MLQEKQIKWSNRAANLIFAGPVSGGSTTPTFRSLVANDLPLGTPIDYTADHSASYTNRSLVDKEYVDNLLTNSYIPYTGTTHPITGDLEFLGEIFIATYYDNGGTAGYTGFVLNTSSQTVEMVREDNINPKASININPLSEINITGTKVNLSTYVSLNNLSNSTALVRTNDNGILIGSADIEDIDNASRNAYFHSYSDVNESIVGLSASDGGTSYTDFTIKTLAGIPTAIIKSDYASFKGLQYDIDYSVNYTNRSLVDKQYVTNAISAAGSGYQPVLGYTAENVANKVTSFTTLNNTLYPTTQAVSNYVTTQLAGYQTALGFTPLSNSVSSGNIIVGNGSNIGTPVSMTGDVTINNTGVTSLASVITASSKGAVDKSLSLTYDAKGRITVATENTIQITESQVTNLTTDLSNRILKVYKDTTDSVAITGTTTNTLVKSIQINGNTFTTSDIFQFFARVEKTGAAGNVTVRMYVNTSASLSGATLLGTATAAGIGQNMYRTPLIKSATDTRILSPTQSVSMDDAASLTVANSSLNIDWTITQYLIVAIQNGNTADSSVCTYTQVIKR